MVLFQTIDALEIRTLLSPVSMIDREQLLLELINRARLNPNAESTRYGVPLNQGLDPGTISSTPKQPLAPHQSLVNAAGLHSQDMLNKDYFSHTNQAGLEASDRAVNAGYPTASVGENIAWSGTTGTLDQNGQVYLRHQALFESPGHRQNMLNPPYEEIGPGIRYGVYTQAGNNYNAIMVTENFGIRSVNPLITGVVYSDNDHDNFYSIGEAVRSGTITATESTSGLVYSDGIGVSGGYRVIVPAGTYNVVCSYTIGGTQYFIAHSVTVASDNVKVDFEAADASTSTLTASVSPGSMNETGGQASVTLTVSRTGSTAAPLVVSLLSSDVTEATLPASVTILAGQASAQVTVTAVNDGIIDGSQSSTLTASASGFPGDTAVVTTFDTTAPLLSTSVVETNAVRPTISWNAVSNAARYEIWVNNVSTGQAQVIHNTNVTGNSYTPTFDLPFGVYNTWVRGFTSAALASQWSLVQTLRIKTPPVVNTSLTTVFTDDFTFNWTVLPGASAYDVWIDRLTSSTIEYYRNTSASQASVSLENFAIGRYGVWVRGLTSPGHIGNWSNRGNVIVSLAPATIEVSATDFSAATTVSWSPVSGATSYEVWVNNRTTGASGVVRQSGVAATSFQLPAMPAAAYAVWVRAYDVQGSFYAWSSAFEFDIRQSARILTPSGTNNAATPLFSWSTVSGADRYELWVASLDGAGRVILETDLTNTSYTPPAALAAGQYRVWVRAFDSSGANTGWSTFRDFSVASIDQPGGRSLRPLVNGDLLVTDDFLQLSEVDSLFVNAAAIALMLEGPANNRFEQDSTQLTEPWQPEDPAKTSLQCPEKTQAVPFQRSQATFHPAGLWPSA